MKVNIINPNTSKEMTEMIRQSALSAAGSTTEIVCTQLKRGPSYASCAYDNVVVSYELVQMVRQAETAGEFDAHVVASFADPALDALREVTDKPVVGIAESAIHFAAFLGYRFSIINSMPRLEKIFRDEVKNAGAEGRLASILLPSRDISDFLNHEDSAMQILVEAAKRTMERDGAEVILLGGGMLSGYAEALSRIIGIPVLDGVKCAVKLAESLVSLGLKTSKFRIFAAPDFEKYQL